MPQSRRQARPGRRSQVLACAVFCVAAALLISMATLYCRSKDFMSHYAAGTLARTAPHELYSLSRQNNIQSQFADRNAFLPWAHPAAEALVFAPLSMLPYPEAFAVWAVISAALLGASVYLLRGRFKSIGDAGTYAVAAAAGVPILSGCWGGQDHVFTLFLYVLGFIYAEQGLDLPAGLFLGLSLIRFQIAFPFVLLFVVLRRWRILGGMLLGGCTLLAASFGLVGSGFLRKYWAVLQFLGSMHDIRTASYMPTIRGLASTVFRGDRQIALGTGIACGAVLLLAAIAWSKRAVSFPLLFASAILIALATDYHGFMYEWSLLLLAGVLILAERPALSWLFFALGAAELAIMFSQTGLFGLLSPVLVILGLWVPYAEQRERALQIAPN